MFLRRVLRFPGASCAEEALTGDDILDGYIRELDARLLGSRAVRLLTLAEMKDHLVEAKAAGVASGLDEGAAAGEAVSAAGPAEEHAREQRGTLWVRFWKMAITWFAFTGIASSLSQFIPAFMPALKWHPLKAVVIAAGQGVTNGMIAGVLMTFWLPRRWIGKAQGIQNLDSAQFDVTYPRPVAIILRIGLPFSAVVYLVAVGAGVAGVLGIFPEARLFVPWWLLVPIVVLLPGAAYEISHLPRVLRVGEEGFCVNSWTGLKLDVLWRDVVGVEVRRWRPARLLSKTGKYLLYRTPSGRTRGIWLRPDTLNHDRFLQVVEENVRLNACPDGSTLPAC